MTEYDFDKMIHGLEYYGKMIKPEFTIDRDNEKVIRLLLQYFFRDPKFEKACPDYSLQKGILLRGDVGTGKSLLMKTFDLLMTKLGLEQRTFVIVPARVIERDYADKGATVFLTYGKSSVKNNGKERIYCFDDLGMESPNTKYYGNELKVMAEILFDRYDLGLTTHGTSNLKFPAFDEIYGNRITSRMTEMFNDVILYGPDRRKRHEKSYKN